MASTALAYRWPDPAEAEFEQVVVPVVGAPSWHQQQADRLTTAFARPMPVKERMPLGIRVAVIVGGAMFGWAVPIAIATSLVR